MKVNHLLGNDWEIMWGENKALTIDVIQKSTKLAWRASSWPLALWSWPNLQIWWTQTCSVWCWWVDQSWKPTRL